MSVDLYKGQLLTQSITLALLRVQSMVFAKMNAADGRVISLTRRGKDEGRFPSGPFS
jgi:hypothetical protein